MSRFSNASMPLSRILLYSAAAVLILIILFIQSAHFNGRDYRQDEAWVVHQALVDAENDGLLAHTLGIFTEVVPENFVQDVWVNVIGHVEPVVRYLSMLFTAIALAALYRFAADLFTPAVGFFSILIFGSLNFYAFFGHEARPYSALIMGSVLFLLFSLRCVKTMKLHYGVLAVVTAAVALYQHSFMLYVIAAQAIFLLVFTRFDMHRYSRIIGMFAAVGIIYLPRFLIISGATHYQGGIDYGLDTEGDALWSALELLHNQMQIRPHAVGIFLLVTGLLLPVITHIRTEQPIFRLSKWWQRVYIVLIPLSILVITLVVNVRVRSITPRNLIIILPALAILAAYALNALPRQAQAVIAIMIAIPFINNFQPLVANAGYRDVANTISDHYHHENSGIVVSASFLWEHVPLSYYLQRRTPLNLTNESLFHLTTTQQKAQYETLPDPPANIVWRSEPEDIANFEAYLADKAWLWVIKGSQWPGMEDFDEVVASEFVLHRQTVLDDGIPDEAQIDGTGYYYPLEVREYRRIPDDISEKARFGDITLQSWLLKDSVEARPCQTITVETWWQTDNALTANYNMTLVLANSDGNGIVNSDGAPGDILTGLWQPGQLVFDERALTLPCDTPTGQYNLLTRLYDYETNTPSGDLYYMTTLSIQ